MTLQFGDVLLRRTPFNQTGGSKIRPAVLALGDDDFLMAPVTFRMRLLEHEFLVGNWSAAGHNTPASVRLDKTTVLPNTAIIRP